jgi:hypothetical protein
MNLIVVHPGTDTYFSVIDAIIIDTDELPAELKAEYEEGSDPSGSWYEYGVGLNRIVEHYMGGKK